uniref:Uncharacterized protein n=1 Tax=Oryza glumipatula TaxID=40148 RepID=A0A0E0BPM5_9ORYZ
MVDSRRLAADGPATAHSTPPATRSPAAVRRVLARLLQPHAAAPLRRPRARPPLALEAGGASRGVMSLKAVGCGWR